MRFFDLVDAAAIPVAVRQALEDLQRNKRLASEKSEAQRLPLLDGWIDKTLESLRTSLPAAVPPFDMVQLDHFFRRAIAG